MEAREEDSSICLLGLVKVEFVGYRVFFYFFKFFMRVFFIFAPTPFHLAFTPHNLPLSGPETN